MEEFKTWFFVGFDHILNVQALDHILFILALVVVYKTNMIKQIIILITAFTIGHSITLVISALDLISYDQKIIEFAIPLTIVITSLNNILNRKKEIRYPFYHIFGGTEDNGSVDLPIFFPCLVLKS